MKKRSRNLNKLHKHQDEISKLPDDILVSIISRLTFREATATSILSTRWRYLHAYFPRLDFPSFSHFRGPHDRGLMNKRSDYEDMINHVLDIHKGHRIKEFKVDMSKVKGVNFEKWFDFALTKEAEVIHIMMIHKGRIFQPSNTILLHGFKCLKELSLSMVDVTDEDFEVLLSNCHVLESLSIMYPNKLRKVSIVGHSNLKHLDLSHVWGLKSFEIRDVINLVSLKCHELNHKCVVQLSDIPKLIKLDFGEDSEGLGHVALFVQIPSCIRDQLELLHLSTSYVFGSRPIYAGLKFVNIKHIEVDMSMDPDMWDGPDEAPLYDLIKACPLLEKLMIKFSWRLDNIDKLEERRGQYSCTVDFHSNHLKELEFTGYLGSLTEFRLALNLLEIARALENLIVVACDLNDSIRRKALARARHDFRQMKSTAVKLLII